MGCWEVGAYPMDALCGVWPSQTCATRSRQRTISNTSTEASDHSEIRQYEATQSHTDGVQPERPQSPTNFYIATLEGRLQQLPPAREWCTSHCSMQNKHRIQTTLDVHRFAEPRCHRLQGRVVSTVDILPWYFLPRQVEMLVVRTAGTG